nr:shikimate dehydrogenase [Maliibacterium massiliense]
MQASYRHNVVGAFGDPIDENPSGVMFEAGFAALGLDWRYALFRVKAQDLKAAMAGMRAMGFSGLNLTIPHKVNAMAYMDSLGASARIIGAINTVVIKNGKLHGENTDGKGFVLGMQSRGVSLADKRLVVLGAGGAARAICVECALAGCASIVIINRTEEAGLALAGCVRAQTGCDARYIPWTAGVHIPACDILINATNIGLYPDASRPDICYADITAGMLVQDIIPNPAQTPFLDAAKAQGATTCDGLGMLVHQGALGIRLWTGKKADTGAMLRALQQL